MNSTQAVRTTLFVFGGQVAARLLDLGAMVLIARSFGEAAFGQFSFALAYVGYFAVLTDLGLSVVFVRELARSRERSADLLAGVLTAKLVLIVVGIGLMIGLILLPGYPPGTVQLVRIVTVALLMSPKLPSFRVVYEQVFQARLQMGIPTLLRLLDGGLLVGLTYGLVRSGQPIQTVMAAYVMSNLPGLLIILWASRRVVTPSSRFDRHLIARLFTQAMPVAFLVIFMALYSRLDVLFLSLWRGDVEMGYYSAAYRLTESLRLVPMAVTTSLYPMMARTHERASETLAEVLASGLKPLLLLVMPICLGVTLFADRLVNLLYTPGFAPAGTALAILVWAELWFFVNSPMSYALFSMDRQRVVTGITCIQLLVSLTANVILIPRWGYLGASIVTVATEGVGTVCYGVIIRRMIGLSCWRVALPLLPSGMLLLVWMLVARTLPLPVVMAGAVLIYGVSLRVTGGVTGRELTTLRTAVIGGR